jgi:hypothetical protein
VDLPLLLDWSWQGAQGIIIRLPQHQHQPLRLASDKKTALGLLSVRRFVPLPIPSPILRQTAI